jgi:hypothetical protein
VVPNRERSDGEVKFNKHEKRLIWVVGIFLVVVWVMAR